MNIAVVTVMQDREAISDLFMDSYLRMHYHTRPNHVHLYSVPYNKKRPLSEQFQAGLNKARKANPDFVFITGCDNVYSADILNRYLSLTEQGFNYIGLVDFHFYDTITEKMYYFAGYQYGRRGDTNGAGRFFAKEVLDKVNWQLFPTPKKSGLDKMTDDVLKNIKGIKSAAIRQAELGIVAIDLKGRLNIWNALDYPVRNIDKEPILTKLNEL